MKKSQTDVLPQTEREWLKTGKFTIHCSSILGHRIRYAITNSVDTNLLVTMVGGIPRDPIRRSKLPLINKLYGLMATKLVDHGINSVLYNQPGTGGSSGDWDSETIDSRSKTLVGLIKHVGKVTKCSKHTLVGSSAGAYMAVRATDLLKDTKNKIDTLLLISPAAYPLLIESIPYGENFSKLIREPWDVVNSPVFNRLERFVSEGGSLLISFFEADDPPIPILIQHCYCAFARKMISQNHDVRVIMIPSVAHNFRRIKTAKSGNVVDNDSIRSTTEEFIRFII